MNTPPNLLHEVDNPDVVTSADVAIFILAHENADSISLPTRKAGLGLKKYYPELKGVIVGCGSSSQDGTREAFFNVASEVPPQDKVSQIYVSTPPEISGRGANIQNVFSMAARLSAKVSVILDADLTSVKASWIKSLVDPILFGSAEYVTPIYVRHRDDIPVTQSLVYPLSRAIFGRRILQPLSVDRAFSASMVPIFQKQDWAIDDVGHKTDLKMMTMAIMAGVPICQVFMPHPRITLARQSATSTVPTICSVVETMFDLMGTNIGFWREVTKSRATAVAGADQPPHTLPPLVEVDCDGLLNTIREMWPAHRHLWSRVLSGPILINVEEKMALATLEEKFSLDTELWRDIVYETALAYQHMDSSKSKKDLSFSLIPIFLLRRLTLHTLGRNLSSSQYLEMVENDARIFEQGKKLLVQKWPMLD